MSIVINGEKITASEAMSILKMFFHDAKELAGQFHGMNRSVKFRTNWPNEYEFAEPEWKSFVEAARTAYAIQLGDPKTSPVDARRMHIAIVLQDTLAKGEETDNRLQLSPNTQQFEGDKGENRRIVEKFGEAPNLRALLRRGAAKINEYH